MDGPFVKKAKCGDNILTLSSKTFSSYSLHKVGHSVIKRYWVCAGLHPARAHHSQEEEHSPSTPPLAGATTPRIYAW